MLLLLYDVFSCCCCTLVWFVLNISVIVRCPVQVVCLSVYVCLHVKYLRVIFLAEFEQQCSSEDLHVTYVEYLNKAIEKISFKEEL